MKLRRIGALAVAAGLVTGLAACSPGGDSGDQTLLIWDTGILGTTLENGDPDMEKSFLDRMAVEFEEANPGVDVEVVQQGGDISTAAAQFQAASIAGNGPDIRIQYACGPTFSYAEYFTDLEPLLSA